MRLHQPTSTHLANADANSTKRCLLIFPLAFYTLHHTIGDALRARGYQVDLMNEEYPFNDCGKVLGKVGIKFNALWLLRWLTLREFRRRLDGEDRYDIIIIFRGRGLGRRLLKYLRTKSEKIVGYNFDSFRINPSPLAWRDLTDKFATFDIVESKRYGAPLVHLFSGVPEDIADLSTEYDLSVIMRLHSKRLAYLREVLEALPDRKTFVFLYEPSFTTLLLGAMRKPWLYYRFRSLIHLTPMSYCDTMVQMGKSHVTLDFAHTWQSGITLRCFEARSLGVRILSSNHHVLENELFSRDNVGLYDLGGAREALQTTFARLREAPAIVQRRDVQDFLDDLLE